MTVIARQLFILIGDGNSGKTMIQKLLIDKICDIPYDRLPVNRLFQIKHPEIKRKYQSISFANRSYQEKADVYGTVDEYFANHFEPADICFISSHLNVGHIADMIRSGRQRFYNVTGVFFSNSIALSQQANSDISLLDWDERLLLNNNLREGEWQINRELNAIADNIVFFIVNRTTIS